MELDELVDDLADDADAYKSREFETDVRETLADEGYETRFLQDFQHDDQLSTYFEVDAEDGTYKIEIVREPEPDVTIYSTPDTCVDHAPLRRPAGNIL